MLQAKNRLKTDQDFQLLARLGRAVSLPLVTLKYRPNHLSYSRLGFVVSVKTDKRAVVRNRAKRRLREIIRLHWADIEPGYDAMFIIRRGTEKLSPAELRTLVWSLIDRAGLCK